MKIFYTIIFFILGIVFGSFFNVVGLRLSKKESILFPSSHCPKCKHVLKFYENIPIISYLFLRGKCSSCKEKISIMYPAVELFSGVLYAVSYYVFGFNIETILAILISSLFCIVLVTDLIYYIILDEVLILFGILIFIYNIIAQGILGACTYVLYGLLMFLFMFILGKLGNFLFKEESLGGGDIKLMGVLGMTTIPFISFASLTVGALVALPCSVFFYIKNKDKIIPFGPFIIIGFLILMFMKVDINMLFDFISFK